MTDSGPRRIGVSIELKPHAYDPGSQSRTVRGRPGAADASPSSSISSSSRFRSCSRCSSSSAASSPSVWPRCSSLAVAAVLAAIVVWAIFYYGMTSAARPRPPSACGSWISRCAPGTARHPISCWARCTPRVLGDGLVLTPFVLLVCFFNVAGACCTTSWSARSSSTIRPAPLTHLRAAPR